MPNYTVPLTCTSLSVSDFLRRRAGISLTLWRKIKRTGTISVNNMLSTAHAIVNAGDTITVTWPQECAIIPECLPITVVYEDDFILIADKPAGMLVHPAAGQPSGTLANAVMYYYREQCYSIGFHPVNRLDKNTSGLVLIAKRPDIQHWFNQNQHTITKLYLAIVSGVPNPPVGVIDLPIGRLPGSIIERMVRSDGQAALTYYRMLTAFTAASLLEVTLATGRTHQIRVHFSHTGHPLLGDDLYGGPIDVISRQALHAAQLKFTHPVSAQPVNVTSPLPNDLGLLIAKLNGMN